MQTFLAALALVFIIEGLMPFLSPKGWRGVFEKILQMNDGQIRFYGLISIVAGLVLLLIVA